MVASAAQLAKRALVTTLLRLAAAYGLKLALTRESADTAVLAAYRKVVLKVRPDKGGKVADAKSLQTTKEAWDRVAVTPSEIIEFHCVNCCSGSSWRKICIKM